MIIGIAGIYLQRSGNAQFPELTRPQQSWTFDDYKGYFVDIAKERSAVYAYSVLRNAHIPPSIDIHRIAHEIGYVHFEQKGLAGMYECTTEFRNACQHAVITQALITNGNQTLNDIAKICAEAPQGGSTSEQCFHGIGHGLLAYFHYDYKHAVTECKKVYEIGLLLRPDRVTQRLWQECVGGATMELTQGEHDKEAWVKAKEVYMPSSDILMPCSADFMPAEVRSVCYGYINPRFFEEAGAIRGVVNPEVYPKALGYCKKILDDTAGSRNGCYAGFGAEFAYFAHGDARTLERMSESSIRKVYEWCAFADDERGEGVCVLSALDTIFWGGQSDSPASILYCSLAPSPALKDKCFTTLISYAHESFGGEQKLEAFCVRLPAEYRERCSSISSSAHAP
jgi:hypothetical protein